MYELDGQQPSTEYWVVPLTGSTGIGSVRAKLMPPTIAAQALRRDVVGLVEDENQLISDQLSVAHFESPS